MRTYEAAPGKMSALHRRFQESALRLFEKHGIKAIGFWEVIVGTINVLYFILAYENMDHREKAWGVFSSDPEWIEARKESEKEGPLVQRTTNMLLRPTPYSPLK